MSRRWLIGDEVETVREGRGLPPWRGRIVGLERYRVQIENSAGICRWRPKSEVQLLRRADEEDEG